MLNFERKTKNQNKNQDDRISVDKTWHNKEQGLLVLGHFLHSNGGMDLIDIDSDGTDLIELWGKRIQYGVDEIWRNNR